MKNVPKMIFYPPHPLYPILKVPEDAKSPFPFSPPSLFHLSRALVLQPSSCVFGGRENFQSPLGRMDGIPPHSPEKRAVPKGKKETSLLPFFAQPPPALNRSRPCSCRGRWIRQVYDQNCMHSFKAGEYFRKNILCSAGIIL